MKFIYFGGKAFIILKYLLSQPGDLEILLFLAMKTWM